VSTPKTQSLAISKQHISLSHIRSSVSHWSGSRFLTPKRNAVLIRCSFKPLSLTTPSPHARTGPPLTHSNKSTESRIPLRSPLSRDNTSSPTLDVTPSRTSNSRLALRDRIASPGPYSQQVLSKSSPASRPRLLNTQSSMSALNSTASRRASMQPQASDPTGLSSPSVKPARPASSLAATRRVSLLPQPRGRQTSVTGRESPQAIAGAASAMKRNGSTTSTDSKGVEKKPWR
jgi:hypothetical protein